MLTPCLTPRIRSRAPEWPEQFGEETSQAGLLRPAQPTPQPFEAAAHELGQCGHSWHGGFLVASPSWRHHSVCVSQEEWRTCSHGSKPYLHTTPRSWLTPGTSDEANFTHRSVTPGISAPSLTPAIWFCSPPGAYRTAPFSRSLTSLLAAGCLSGGTSGPCHLWGLWRNRSGNVLRDSSRNDAQSGFPSTGQPGLRRTAEQRDPEIPHAASWSQKRLKPNMFLSLKTLC